MIDDLFGSKTRVKLLYLFFSNPDKEFYVREITRIISEQINSVRRELSNMLSIGVIDSRNDENKLFYKVNKQFDKYRELSGLFNKNLNSSSYIATSTVDSTRTGDVSRWSRSLSDMNGLSVAVISGILVDNSVSEVDLLLVGEVGKAKLDSLVRDIEKSIEKEINYAVLTYDDLYLRLSVNDRFIQRIVSGGAKVILDRKNIFIDGSESNV